jgi:molecular chaperone GrpE
MFRYDDYPPARRIPVRNLDDGSGTLPANGVTAPPLPEPDMPEAETDWKTLALRLQAEMMNFRKRQERRADEAGAAEQERLLRRVLPVVDNLKRALDSPGGDRSHTALVQGVDLTRRELLRLLESEGVTAIAAIGTSFTPALHEAVATVPDPRRAGTVVEVIEPGYTLHGRLLRPARVVVAA